MRDLLRKEVRGARLHAAVGATSEAERYIRVALKPIDAAPAGAFSRSIRARIQEAGFAISQKDARLATATIDKLLRELEEKQNR
jgi:hypothetical protein